MILKKWGIFLKERAITFFMIGMPLGFAVHALLQIVNGSNTVTFTLETFIGSVTASFLLIYLRVTDEFKDYEADKKYFPHRPLPSGRVSIKELTYFKWFIIVFVALINLLTPVAYLELTITVIFYIAMGEWFFLPERFFKNRMVALITHCPHYFLSSFYVIALFAKANNLPLYTLENVHIAFWFMLSSTWLLDIPRKTLAPGDEQEGESTYSSLLGIKPASIISILATVFHFILFLLVLKLWKMSGVFVYILGGLGALFIFGAINFMIKPETKKAGAMQFSMLLYVLSSYLVVIINSLVI